MAWAISCAIDAWLALSSKGSFCGAGLDLGAWESVSEDMLMKSGIGIGWVRGGVATDCVGGGVDETVDLAVVRLRSAARVVSRVELMEVRARDCASRDRVKVRLDWRISYVS